MNEGMTPLVRAQKILLVSMLRNGYYTAEDRNTIEQLFGAKSTLLRMVYTTDRLYAESLQRFTDKLEKLQIDPLKVTFPSDYKSFDELAEVVPELKQIFDEIKDEYDARKQTN